MPSLCSLRHCKVMLGNSSLTVLYCLMLLSRRLRPVVSLHTAQYYRLPLLLPLHKRCRMQAAPRRQLCLPTRLSLLLLLLLHQQASALMLRTRHFHLLLCRVSSSLLPRPLCQNHRPLLAAVKLLNQKRRWQSGPSSCWQLKTLLAVSVGVKILSLVQLHLNSRLHRHQQLSHLNILT